MRNFARLQSNNGTFCEVGFDFNSSYEELVHSYGIDFLILATENGFSPLGLARSIISKELNIPVDKIIEWADWNRFENNEVSNIGLKPQQKAGTLKGVVLAACENSKCYKKFERQHFDTWERKATSIPDRDFYYNVTFEAIYYAAIICGAKKIAVSHLSASGNYHQDIATCTAEALAHFHDEYPNKIQSFSFVGCCITEYHLRGTQRLNNETKSKHQGIDKVTKEFEFGDIITLNIKKREKS
jgi:hypothetical protein